MKIVDALSRVTDSLAEANVPTPQADAYWLICYAAGITKSELMNRLTFDESLNSQQVETLLTAVEKRKQRIPGRRSH